MTYEALRTAPIADSFTAWVRETAQKLRTSFYVSQATRPGGDRFCKLSDDLLDDIGITRLEAEDLDRRSGEVVAAPMSSGR